MRSFGSTSCSVHAFWASQNTQSTTCARNLDEAMIENFCCLSAATLLFPSFSGPLPPAWEKQTSEQQQRWEAEINPSLVFELALTSCLVPRISELLSETSSCVCNTAQKEKRLDVILHGTLQHLSGTKKFSSAQHVTRAVECPEGYEALWALRAL